MGRDEQITPMCGDGAHLLCGARFWWRTPTHWEGLAVAAPAADAEAQYRLGWPAETVLTERMRRRHLRTRIGAGRPVAQSPDVLVREALVAVHPKKKTCVGAVMLNLEAGTLGGYLAPDYRGRGFGEELFRVGAAFAHHHLGLEVIRAGADPANVASVRALHAAGFVPADGPAAHELPDGRVISAEWFQHCHPAASPCSAI